MIGFVKDKFIYIKCPKNRCMTYTGVLERNGWQEINLFENKLNLNEYLLWGHLTEPNTRHTKGVSQFLKLNPDIDVNNRTIGKMLVSGVFAEHTYSINMMMGSLFCLPIYWIPLDAEIKNFNHPDTKDKLVICNGDDLTNDFFKEHNINITVTPADCRNQSTVQEQLTRQQIENYKQVYDSNYQKLVKNFLEPDILMYNKTVAQFRIKYGS